MHKPGANQLPESAQCEQIAAEGLGLDSSTPGRLKAPPLRSE
jgi:hypothetical protein